MNWAFYRYFEARFIRHLSTSFSLSDFLQKSDCISTKYQTQFKLLSLTSINSKPSSYGSEGFFIVHSKTVNCKISVWKTLEKPSLVLMSFPLNAVLPASLITSSEVLHSNKLEKSEI